MARGTFCLTLIAGLSFTSAVGVAAPVPKKKTPTVEVSVTRAEKDSDRIAFTVANNTQEVLTWEYSTSPLAAFEFEVRDAKGERVETIHPDVSLSPLSVAKTVSVEPGDDFTYRIILAGLCSRGKLPSGKLTVKVIFHHGKTKYESDPLVVE